MKEKNSKGNILNNIGYSDKLESIENVKEVFRYIKKNKESLDKLTEESVETEKKQQKVGTWMCFFFCLMSGVVFHFGSGGISLIAFFVAVFFLLLFIDGLFNYGKVTEQLTEEEFNSIKKSNKFFKSTIGDLMGYKNNDFSLNHYKKPEKGLYNSTNLVIEMLEVIAQENSKKIFLKENEIEYFKKNICFFINKSIIFKEKEYLKDQNFITKIGFLDQTMKVQERVSTDSGTKTKWVKRTIPKIISYAEEIDIKGHIVIKKEAHRYYHDIPSNSKYSSIFGGIVKLFSNKYTISKNKDLLKFVTKDKKFDIHGDDEIVKKFIESKNFQYIFNNQLINYINYIEIKDNKLMILFSESISELYNMEPECITYKINDFDELLEYENEIVNYPIKYDYHEIIFDIFKNIRKM